MLLPDWAMPHWLYGSAKLPICFGHSTGSPSRDISWFSSSLPPPTFGRWYKPRALGLSQLRHVLTANYWTKALFVQLQKRRALKLNSVAWVRKRTIPTEWPQLVGEVSFNSLRIESRGQRDGSYGRILGFLDRLHNTINGLSINFINIFIRVVQI
jgi:hypothetical protein